MNFSQYISAVSIWPSTVFNFVQSKRQHFKYEIAKPQVTKRTVQKCKEFKWEIFQQPPYSPDRTPSNFYIFSSLQNHLSGKSMILWMELETTLQLSLKQKYTDSSKKVFKIF